MAQTFFGKTYEAKPRPGSNYNESMQDWQIRTIEEGGIDKKLGLTTMQLITNPQMATDAQALAKYTGIPLEQAQYRISQLGGLTAPAGGAGSFSALEAGATAREQASGITYGAGGTIPTSTLQPQTPITVPPPPTPTNNADVAVAGATQQATQTNADITAAKTAQSETQKQYDTLSNEISSLLGTTVGRGEAQLSAEQANNVPGLQQNLQDVNKQIQTKLAEFNKIQDQYAEATQVQEGKTIPMNLIIGRQAEINRALALQKNTYASDIGLLQAQASAIQGNLQLAQQTADRAVDLKYEDAKTLLDVKMQQLSLINDKLTREEKVTADALDRQYQTERDNLAIKVANEKDMNATLLNLMQTYPDAKISLTDTIEQANAKITSGSKIYADKVAVGGSGGGSGGTTTGNKPLDILDIQRWQEAYPDAGITAGDTQTTATAKVQGLNKPREFSEADLTTAITDDKNNKMSYEDIIAGIDSNPLIANKDLAKQVAAKVYGRKVVAPIMGTGTSANISLDDAIKQKQDQNTAMGIPKNTGIREELYKMGYPIKEIDNRLSFGANILNSISGFLFGNK